MSDLDKLRTVFDYIGQAAMSLYSYKHEEENLVYKARVALFEAEEAISALIKTERDKRQPKKIDLTKPFVM